MDITYRCIVAVLSSRLPGQYRKNKTKTSEVCREAGASESAGRWSDAVWPAEAIEEARAQIGATRELLYSRSVPWLADGQRLVLVGEMMALRPRIDEAIRQFDAIADASAARYDEWVAQARRERNGLYREQDYRGREHFRSRFALDVQYLPVPDASHIVCQLADDDIRVLREGVSTQVSEALEAGRRDVLDRIADPLRRMVERLSDPDAIFRDSLTANLREVAEALPALNLTGDLTIAAVAADVARLGAEDPETLRINRRRRRTVADIAASVLARVEAAA